MASGAPVATGRGKRETERDETFHDFEGFLFQMIPILIDGPAVEPVTLAEMKAYLRVDEDDGTQDELIAGLDQGGPAHGRGGLAPRS